MVRKHFLALDGLRGVAAISVVIFHRRWLGPGGHAFDHGFMAVGFFFMLSGFVIDHAYTSRLRSTMSLATFAKLRIIRLYPMIVAGAVLGMSLALALALHRHEFSGVRNLLVAGALAAACLPAPPSISSLPFLINRPTWSLFFELIANVVYALVLSRLRIGLLLLLTVIALGASLAMAVVLNTLSAGYTFADFFWGFAAVAPRFSLAFSSTEPARGVGSGRCRSGCRRSC